MTSAHSTDRVAAVILAAGAGSRFGSAKAAVRIGSRTMLEIVADTATAAGLSPVIVVAPSSLTPPGSAEAVRNDDPTLGMSRSLRLGIRAVPADAGAAVVLLADQPTVEVGHLHALDASRGSSPIVATRTDGVLGPPALLEREAFSLVEELEGDAGLRDILRREPSLVTPVDHAPIPDVDTPADMAGITEACPGCGARYLPYATDERHPYLGASPACWAAFGELLAREFGQPAYGRVHRHSVDVFAAQHPGGDDRRARQSVALHLVALCHWLEHGLEAEQLNAITVRLAAAGREWPSLSAPRSYATTVVDVLAARDGPAHASLVRRWAEATWLAWSRHHEAVRAWAREALGPGR